MAYTYKLLSGQIIIDRRKNVKVEAVRIINEAVSKLSIKESDYSNEGIVRAEINFNRQLGIQRVVPVTEESSIFYAKRIGKLGYSKFVKNTQPIQTQSVVLVFKKDNILPNTFFMIAAYVGNLTEPEPWDLNATEQSLEFWNNHAFIHDEKARDEIISETITADYPW